MKKSNFQHIKLSVNAKSTNTKSILAQNKILSSSLYLKSNKNQHYLKKVKFKNKKYNFISNIITKKLNNNTLIQEYLRQLLNKSLINYKLNIKKNWNNKYHPVLSTINNNTPNKNKISLLAKKAFKNLIKQANKPSFKLKTSNEITLKRQYKLTVNHNKKFALTALPLGTTNKKLYNSILSTRRNTNKKQLNFLFESLNLMKMTELGFHYGCKKRNRNRTIEHFYGRYSLIQQNSYVNINIMIMNLRKGLNFIRNALIRNSQLLLVSWSKELHRIPVKVFKQSFFFKGPWFPGFLSNFRNIRQHGSFWYKSKFFPKKKKRKQAPLTTLALSELGIKTFPNLLFTLDSSYVNASSINEALFLRMPSVAFINPTQFFDINHCIYPVLGSCSTYKQGRFFIFLVAMLLLDISLYRKARIYKLERPIL